MVTAVQGTTQSMVAKDVTNWKLVGPWYRWPQPGVPASGRLTAPSLQKFAGNNFIPEFLAKPQHSLKFDPVVDVVNNFDLVQLDKTKWSRMLMVLNAKGDPASKDELKDTKDLYISRLAPSKLRKLYQPTHDRHYLVTCELHCDLPGFPRVTRDQVCQTGFVVRRRTSTNPKGVSVDEINKQQAKPRVFEADLFDLYKLEQVGVDAQARAADPSDPVKQKAAQDMVANVEAQKLKLAKDAKFNTWAELVHDKQTKLADAQAVLKKWYEDKQIDVQVEGWFPIMTNGRPSTTFGEWRVLSQEAQDSEIWQGDDQASEHTYPMFALVPDVREPKHDAAGRTMYYGIVPTTSLQHDNQGQARFDDKYTYEVRCFVRRHEPCLGRVGKQPDCHGPLAWSRPTESFRVAAPFDVLGSANRPITIKLPDLRELAAQAASRPKGRLSPVRMVQPQHMSTQTDGAGLTGGAMSGEAICSFSIPLITLVALFLLNLFLPIVVFIFQLWFLLVFRFCIPPSISASAGLDAALSVTPPSVDLDVDFTIKVDGVDKLVKAADLTADLLGGGAAKRMKEDTGLDTKPDLSALSNNTIGNIDQSQLDNKALQPHADGSLPPPPPVGEPLVYEDPVTPMWTLAGAKA
jgi:hypothetical protein